MDFGFSSLIEKFEERIGVLPTTALLWLAAFAAFVLCVRTIVEAIIPVVVFFQSVGSSPVQSLIEKLLIGMLVGSVSGAVFVCIIRLLVSRAVAPIIARADAAVAMAEKMTADAIASTTEMTENLNQLAEEAEMQLAKKLPPSFSADP